MTRARRGDDALPQMMSSLPCSRNRAHFVVLWAGRVRRRRLRSGVVVAVVVLLLLFLSYSHNDTTCYYYFSYTPHNPRDRTTTMTTVLPVRLFYYYIYGPLSPRPNTYTL